MLHVYVKIYIYVTWHLSLLHTGYQLYVCSLWEVYYCSLKISHGLEKTEYVIVLEVCSSIGSHCVYQLYSMLKMKLFLSPTCAWCESMLLSAWPHFLVLPKACVDTYMSSGEPDVLKMHIWTAVVYVSHCSSWMVIFSLGCFCYVQC